MTLRTAIEECQKCGLYVFATHKVLGSGVSNPAIIVVGEAPGREEDACGQPFVGNSGKELIPKLNELGKSYHITNVMKCRPCDSKDGPNRPPNFQERLSCSGWLEEHVSRLKANNPDAIILMLGKTAYVTLAKDKMKKNWLGPCETIFGPGFCIPHPAAHIYEGPDQNIKKAEWTIGWLNFKRFLQVGAVEDQPFAQLHCHTEYSEGDSTNKVGELCEALLKKGFSHGAITDHYTMSGVLEFYNECKSRNINPILGIEASFACELQDDPGHMTLLAKSYKGMQNIFRMIGYSAKDANDIKKPKIRNPILKKHLFAFNEDVFVLTACINGYIPKHLDRLDLIQEFKDHFPGRFYLEVMPTKVHHDLNRKLYALHKSMDIPLVATNDVHYIEAKHAIIHKSLVGIRLKKKIDDDFGFDGNCYWLKTWDEMVADVPDDIRSILELGKTNSLVIARQCKIEIPNEVHLPNVCDNPDKVLQELVYANFPSNLPVIYQERLEKEFDLIKSKNFANYFLMIEGIFKYCRSQKIMTQCRGSVGGCLIAYLLKWTDVDPIKCEIPFERFLNKDRSGLPDIDIDTDAQFRDQIIKDHLIPTYGEDCVAWFTIQPLTFGAKTAINDISRLFNVDRSLTELVKKDDELVYHEKYPKEAFEHAVYIQGQVKTKTVHPAAVIVCESPICNFAPVEYRPQKDKTKSHYYLHSQFSHEGCEQIGLVKFDLLRQDSLSIINKCEELMPADKLARFRELPENDPDPEVWSYYQRGLTAGAFQVSGQGMREVLVKAKPKTLGDLADIISVYRPGPIEAGIVDDYVNFKGDPLLADWCHWSRNCLIYQEQVMYILNGMGGIPLDETDKVRSIISKKKSMTLIEKMRVKFLEGAVKKNYNRDIANSVFDKMLSFAHYAFNKAHAFLYARRSYRTMWLKVYAPGEFFLATMIYGKKDMTDLIVEMRKRGIRIEDPDVNTSAAHFTQDGNVIFGALTAIDGVGFKVAEKIIASRPYKTIGQLKDVLSPSLIITLAKARALRSIEPDHGKAIFYAERDGCLTLETCTLENSGPPTLSAIQSYITRSTVVKFPAFDHPIEKTDTSQMLRLRKLDGLTEGVHYIMAIIKDVDSTTKRNRITIEDDSGERECYAWQSSDLGLEDLMGGLAGLCINIDKQGTEIIDAYSLSEFTLLPILYQPFFGETDGNFISGEMVVINSFKTHADKQMATVYIQNRGNGAKVMMWPKTWETHGTKCIKFKGVNRMPMGKTEDGTLFAKM